MKKGDDTNLWYYFGTSALKYLTLFKQFEHNFEYNFK